MGKSSLLGTRIIVSLIAITSCSIAIINLLTIFGVLSSPDLMGYAGLIGLFLLPLVVIGAALNKIISEEKRAFQQMADRPTTSGAKIELKINFKENETIMGDTTSHPGYYVKIAIASALSVATGLFTYLFVSEGFTGDLVNMFPLLMPLILVSITIHIFSKHLFDPNGWRVFLEHTWITLFVIGISISGLMTLQNYIRATYPKNFWENFLGLPFSLITILFLIMMLLIGGILIRLGDIISLETSPLKASGLSIVLVSIAFLVPQFNIIDWNVLLGFISEGFSFLLILYGIATALLFYKDAGMRVLITNQRIIKLDTNKLENSSYYPLEYLKNIRIIQDLLSERMGYGNVVTTFYKGKRTSEKVLCILYGVKEPELLANTIRAISDMKKRKSTPVKKKPVKKKRGPIKKKPLKKRKIKKKKKKEDKEMYYRSLIPVILVMTTLLFSNAHIVDASQDIVTRTRAEPDELIHESFDIRYLNTSYIEISTVQEVYEYTFRGDLLNSSELRVMYDDPSLQSDIRDEFYQEFTEKIDFVLNDTYGVTTDSRTADIEYDFFLDEESLETGNPPDEPVVFTGDISLRLKAGHFSLPSEADLEDIFYGVFKVGGKMKQNISFPCEAGHRVDYILNSPDGLLFTEDQYLTEEISVTIDNLDGSQIKKKERDISLVHEDPVDISQQKFSSDLVIDIFALKRSAKREYIELDVNLTGSFYSSEIPSYISSEMPEELELGYINSASIRLLYQNGFHDDVDDFFESLEEELKVRLEKISDDPITDSIVLKGLDDDYDVSVMSSAEPIRFYFNSSFENTISEYEQGAESLKTKYLIEQSVSFTVGSFECCPVNYTLYIPDGLRLTEARTGQRQLDINIDNDGRYYVEDSIPQEDEYKLVLKIGTIVDIGSLIPFVIMIFILLIAWLGLQAVPIRKKKTPYYEA